MTSGSVTKIAAVTVIKIFMCFLGLGLDYGSNVEKFETLS